MVHSLLVNAVVFTIICTSSIISCPVYAQGTAMPGTLRLRDRVSFGSSNTNIPAVTVNVTAPVVNRTVGSSFLLPVTVSDMTGAGIISWQFDLLYDPTIIVPQIVPIDTAGTLSSGFLPTVNPSAPGLLKVVFFGTIPPSGSGVLFNFKFTAVGTAGQTSPLTWVNFMFNEGSPGSFASNGSVTLVPPTAAGVSVGGMVMNAAGEPLANVRVTLTNSVGMTLAARSNGFGYYRFDDVPAGADYIIAASSKRFAFSTQVISVTDQLQNVNLVASP